MTTFFSFPLPSQKYVQLEAALIPEKQADLVGKITIFESIKGLLGSKLGESMHFANPGFQTQLNLKYGLWSQTVSNG